MLVVVVLVRENPIDRLLLSSDSESVSEITTTTLEPGSRVGLGGEMRLLVLNWLSLERESAMGVLACELTRLMAASCG